MDWVIAYQLALGLLGVVGAISLGLALCIALASAARDQSQGGATDGGTDEA